MKKILSLLLISSLFCSFLFAGGQKETGRNSIAGTADAGGIIDASYIDTSSFINAYQFPYKANEQDDLSIFLLNNSVSYLTAGGTQSIVLGLRTNLPSFYDARDVNYVMYIQNPAFLNTERSFKVFESSLLSIFDAKSSGTRLALFSAQTGSIRFISSKTEVTSALLETAKEAKVKQNLKTASLAFTAIKNDGNTNPWRFMWVTDENVLQSYTDISSFKVLTSMYAAVDTSFSLLCYGSSPQWGAVNDMLTGIKGSSYYGKTYQYLESTIFSDFIQFSKPAVSNITLTIASSPWLGGNTQASIDLGSLGSGQSFMIQQDLELPAFEAMPLMRKDEKFTAAYCYISYFSHKENKLKYITLAIDASYTDSIDQWYSSRNPIARKYITLSKTGEALASMSKSFKLGNYSSAFEALDTQLLNLKEVDPAGTDILIRSDVQLLEKTRASLFNQVQSLLVLE